MPAITRNSLMSLERYAQERPAFRARGLAHKRNRRLALGDHLTLIFEDELTIRYQIQEMLWIEKIFEEDGIQGELEAYNPLIPDGSNFKATLLIEYPNVEERRIMLARMKSIEDWVWVRVEGCERIWAIANEDLDRENDEKPSTVHFLRFELTPTMKNRLRQGAPLAVGVDHADYATEVSVIPQTLRQSLVEDLS